MSDKNSIIQKGSFMSFQDYLNKCRKQVERVTHWPNNTINTSLSCLDGSARGSLCLVNGDRSLCGEAAPGLSMSIQQIKPNKATTPHSHSFWHLYTVIDGTGLLGIDESETLPLSKGDVIYIPSWQLHHFQNTNQSTALKLYVIQNLPAHVETGTLMRREAEKITFIYASNLS